MYELQCRRVDTDEIGILVFILVLNVSVRK